MMRRCPSCNTQQSFMIGDTVCPSCGKEGQLRPPNGLDSAIRKIRSANYAMEHNDPMAASILLQEAAIDMVRTATDNDLPVPPSVTAYNDPYGIINPNGRDFLDEIIEERTAKNPDFPKLVNAASRFPKGPCTECGHAHELHWCSPGGEGCDGEGCKCSGRSRFADQIEDEEILEGEVVDDA